MFSSKKCDQIASFFHMLMENLFWKWIHWRTWEFLIIDLMINVVHFNRKRFLNFCYCFSLHYLFYSLVLKKHLLIKSSEGFTVNNHRLFRFGGSRTCHVNLIPTLRKFRSGSANNQKLEPGGYDISTSAGTLSLQARDKKTLDKTRGMEWKGDHPWIVHRGKTADSAVVVI